MLTLTDMVIVQNFVVVYDKLNSEVWISSK
jgi:hypothetical protein